MNCVLLFHFKYHIYDNIYYVSVTWTSWDSPILCIERAFQNKERLSSPIGNS